MQPRLYEDARQGLWTRWIKQAGCGWGLSLLMFLIEYNVINLFPKAHCISVTIHSKIPKPRLIFILVVGMGSRFPCRIQAPWNFSWTFCERANYGVDGDCHSCVCPMTIGPQGVLCHEQIYWPPLSCRVQLDIIRTLKMSEEHLFKAVHPFNRANLFYEVPHEMFLFDNFDNAYTGPIYIDHGLRFADERHLWLHLHTSSTTKKALVWNYILQDARYMRWVICLPPRAGSEC
jgi:hypothetical protein